MKLSIDKIMGRRAVITDLGRFEVIWVGEKPVLVRDWVKNETHITTAATAGQGVHDFLINEFLANDETTKLIQYKSRRDFEGRILLLLSP